MGKRRKHAGRWAAACAAGALAACRADAPPRADGRIASTPPGADSGSPPPAASAGCRDEELRRTALEFGRALRRVSVLDPAGARRAMREAYAPYVSPELLARWTSDPSSAPGRAASNPFPQRIEIGSVVHEGGGCRIEGAVVEVATPDTTAIVARDSVRLVLANRGGWRITALDRLGPSRPVAPVDDADHGAAEAVRVLEDYYAALRARDFARAWRLWSAEGGASGQSEAQFAAGFAETLTTTVETATPGPIEGAAGSRYVEVPVVVRARTRAGEAQRFEGTYTLRRSVVDGATPAQRSWRIAGARLREVR